MVEYRKIFLNKIKSLLPYLVKFFDNSFMISKKYSNNYIIEELN